jgi:guanylate kinase
VTSDAKGHLFVVSAPSGAGKSTLIHRVRERVEGLAFSVSWTTRPARPGERDGVDYHFTDDERFRRKVADGEMLEWAEVHGRLYGTGRAETDALRGRGLDVILDIDVQGAAQVLQTAPDAITVFVLPPGRAELARRLRGRGTEDEARVAARLAVAAEEVEQVDRFDYVVINDELEPAARELEAILVAGRARRDRRAPRVREIVGTFRRGAGEAAERGRPEARDEREDPR